MPKSFSTVIVADLHDTDISPLIESVLKQDWPKIELLVIDNGSKFSDTTRIAECIRKNRKNNLESVYIVKNNQRKQCTELLDQIISLVKGDIVIILSAIIKIDSTDVLQKIYQYIIDNDAAKCYLRVKTMSGNPLIGNEPINIPIFSVDEKPSNTICNSDSLCFATTFTHLDKSWIEVKDIQDVNFVMPKMNFSKKKHFETLVLPVTDLFTKPQKMQLIVRTIDDEISLCYSRGINSTWGITSSDEAYIFYCSIIATYLKKSLQRTGMHRLADDNKKVCIAIIDQALTNAETKLKAVFFAQEFTVWPSLHSVFLACVQDERFISQAVYVPFRSADNTVPNSVMEPYWKSGVPVLPFSMYDVCKESPDIAFFLKPYDMVPHAFTVEQIANAIDRLVFIPYAIPLLIFEQDIDFTFQLPLSAVCWKIVGGNKSYNELAKIYGMRRGENLLPLPHPRTDAVFDRQKTVSWPHEWGNRPENKTIVFYNASAMVEPNKGYSTFIENHKDIFNYLKDKEDFLLIWRPHPRLKSRTVESEQMTEGEWDSLYEFLENQSNIIVDTTTDYLNALLWADVMVSDLSTLLVEYILLDRPMFLLMNEHFDYRGLYVNSFLDVCEKSSDIEDLYKFLKTITNDEETLSQPRKTFLENNLYLSKSSAGEMIRDYVYEQVIIEESTKSGR